MLAPNATKEFSGQKHVHVGMEPSKTSQMSSQHFHTIPNLVPFCQLCIAFAVCIGGLWKAVEWVCMGGCNLVATGHGRHSRYGLHYMLKVVV